MKNERIFYIYILTNYSKSVLYTGFTNDIVRRIIEHKNDLGCEFTRKYNVKYLIHYEQFQDVRNAIEREKEIKKWRREEKLSLIKSMNPNLNDLSGKLFRDLGIAEEEISATIRELREKYKDQ